MRTRSAAGAIDPEWIAAQTPPIAWERLSVALYAEVESTNTEASERARAGAPAGLLLIADHQTAGRGRRGRRWITARGASLCFSLVVRPRCERRQWPLLSLAASSALARCLRAFVGGVELKWPNDVLIGGRKVAGILVETVDSPASPPAAVIGVGVNVGRDSIPSGMEDSATSLCAAAGSAPSMQAILVSFLREFQEAYLLVEAGRHCEVVGQWMSMAPMSRNARVWLEEGNRRREAITCGLTELGELRVRFPDGSDATVLAADVSLRPLGPVTKCQ